MTANELRIGNYLMYQSKYLVAITKIDSIEDTIMCEVVDVLKFDGPEDFYVETTPELTVDNPNYESIPLTEEWLLKFGFKYHDRDVSHGKRHIERFYISPYFGEHREYWLELQLNDNVLKTYFAWLMWDIGRGQSFIHLPHGHKLGFVHKLQNIYFELSESELNLK